MYTRSKSIQRWLVFQYITVSLSSYTEPLNTQVLYSILCHWPTAMNEHVNTPTRCWINASLSHWIIISMRQHADPGLYHRFNSLTSTGQHFVKSTVQQVNISSLQYAKSRHVNTSTFCHVSTSASCHVNTSTYCHVSTSTYCHVNTSTCNHNTKTIAY